VVRLHARGEVLTEQEIELKKLTHAQRAQRERATRQAVMAALRGHFMGEEAATHRWSFLRGALLASTSWFAKLLCLASWAAVAGVLVGPEHATLFKSMHAWLLSMPVDEALSQAHAVFVSVVWELVKVSLVLGIGQKLLIIVKPAIEQVKRDFEVAGRAA
jgi:hypothetical protein